MSLTRRLVLSFVVILSLSLSSILVHVWANDIRKRNVALLQDVIRTQSLVNDFAQRLQNMHKKILVVETLREADNSEVLTQEEKQDIAQRLATLSEDEGRLSAKLQRFLDEGSRVDIGAAQLLADWSAFIADGARARLAVPATPYAMVNDRLTKNEWLLLAKSDSINHELRKVVSLTNRIALGVFLFSLVVTVLLAYHVIRYTRRSIRVLQRGTAEWGAGNLGYRMPDIGRDELGELAQSFNAMAGNLRMAMDEVREASRQADAANQAKSSFLANMSHELRTPMNAIIGYSEMLMEEADEAPTLPAAELRPDLEKILTAGKHLLELINDVLDISKIESGKMSVYIERAELRAVLDSVQATVKPLLEKNGNTLECQYRLDEQFINTDVTRFRQIVLNLLSNAAKFTHDGTVTLAVEGYERDGRRLLEISVADTGIGMSPEQIERVFDAFIQADLSTTKQYGGSGLGLTISRKFAQLLGGDIVVESELGEGSRFRLLLPLPEDAEALPPVMPVAATAAANAISAGTVLVIDDDAAALDISRRILSRENYRVVVAGSGQEGIDKALECKPDVVVLDVMMPGMDGWQVLKMLRDNERTRDIPVLMQSMLNERDLAMLLGASEYLVKPIERDKLSRAVRALLPAEHSGNLLVLESDGELAALIEEQLGSDSWELFKLDDVAQAQELLDTVPFQLIVIGEHRDTEAVAEFMERLQGSPEHRHIPLLLIGASASETAIVEQLQCYLRRQTPAPGEVRVEAG